MRPEDANVAGNVHGGTGPWKMIEEAGAIISTRHRNSQERGRRLGTRQLRPGLSW